MNFLISFLYIEEIALCMFVNVGKNGEYLDHVIVIGQLVGPHPKMGAGYFS